MVIITSKISFPSISITSVALGLGILALAFANCNAQNSPADYLAGHNAARAEVGVGPMVWNDTLAAYARAYASQRDGDCALVLSDKEGVFGENLAVCNPCNGFTAMDAVNLWLQGKKYYFYNSNSCVGGNCLPYTQVVWRNSIHLGCARAQCSNGGVFVICYYDPPGNINGERPY